MNENTRCIVSPEKPLGLWDDDILYDCFSPKKLGWFDLDKMYPKVTYDDFIICWYEADDCLYCFELEEGEIYKVEEVLFILGADLTDDDPLPVDIDFDFGGDADDFSGYGCYGIVERV